jgi:hypothetical protein
MPRYSKSGLPDRVAARNRQKRLLCPKLRLLDYLRRLELEELRAVVKAAKTHFGPKPGRPKNMMM